MKTALLPFLAFVTLLSACAHHRDVRPGESVHRVSVQTDDQEEGSRDAIAQANHFCAEKNKSAVFIDENKKYTGDMDEKTYNNAKRATKVGAAVGSAGYVFGGKNESALGGIVGLGSGAANAALGKAYNVEMKFKYQ